MKKYIVATYVAIIAVVFGITGMGVYNTYTTLGLERQEPHFTISLIVAVVGLLAMAVIRFCEKRAERKLAQDRRRAARWYRQDARERATSRFVDWRDLRDVPSY